MISTLKKPVVARDRVIILNGDGTADIATVYDQDDRAVYASSGPDQDYAIPIEDTKVKSYVGGLGRIYLLAADPEYVQDTKRLAELEKSIVLRHVTQFQKRLDDNNKKINIKEIMLYLLIAILLLAVIFK